MVKKIFNMSNFPKKKILVSSIVLKSALYKFWNPKKFKSYNRMNVRIKML